MRIVRLDLKTENILLSESGHILITDFDRSFDASERREPPNAWCSSDGDSATNSTELAKAGLTPNEIGELFANFEFTNPLL
ncbi:hypothetical protein EGR_08223 [Echinococcus granulosus]|uniref:Protein kinase domain-containing protein n=1 Tax=Echinococcus granulosus TaxID=6210 RepID=W6UFL1_ECHGR|nr:hypothetical protein EGR_08223 [Echinococcus granulosus]EUB56917.1 hypothetical protein EGR_08223 [Echinococcus granulosus]